MRTITKFIRLYKSEYSVGIVKKLMSNGNFVVFSRKGLLNSFKLSARFFKNAVFFKKFFSKTDMITLYISGVNLLVLLGLKKDDAFFILKPYNNCYVINSFEDFKLIVVNKVTGNELCLDLFNLYLQYFIDVSNGNL
jgi:hypothetical protein